MTKIGIKEIYYTYKYTLGICYENILKTYLTENNLFNLLTLLRRHKYYFFKTKFMVLYCNVFIKYTRLYSDLLNLQKYNIFLFTLPRILYHNPNLFYN